MRATNPDREMTAAFPAAATTCPTCGAVVQARYCGECGERMLSARDHSFVAFVGEAASHVFTLDNRLWRTLRALVRPGLLTTEYVAGRRRSYLSPVQLFVLLTVAFFFIGPSMGLMNTRLAQFERDAITSQVAVPIVNLGMTRTGLDHAQFTTLFERRMEAQRRLLILLAVPIFALVLKVLYWRRPYMVHLVFSTHAVATLLILLFAWLLVIFLILAVIHPLVAGTSARLWPPGRGTAIVVVAAPVVVFLHMALRRVHGDGYVLTLAKSFVAAIGLSISLIVYEHLLFFTTALAILLRT